MAESELCRARSLCRHVPLPLSIAVVVIVVGLCASTSLKPVVSESRSGSRVPNTVPTRALSQHRFSSFSLKSVTLRGTPRVAGFAAWARCVCVFSGLTLALLLPIVVPMQGCVASGNINRTTSSARCLEICTKD